ncbi:hypothetical protein SPIRO4BDMA_40307 [uncultured spirochete]|uniref:Uncharacterized protein n=1 Tax=uncultured spirochete TaxID=156406 RepID=A0A3P3XN77_9SPIR|nr:hypothetical protein SPIRO4BDMA_40307 [uncultured spirochete]
MILISGYLMKRVSFEYPEIDSLQLQQSLKDYAFPRDRVTRLLRMCRWNTRCGTTTSSRKPSVW